MTTHTLPLSPVTPIFVCDVHLGKLARRLRLLGFDTVYRNDLEDEEIIGIAGTDDRVILTWDGGILGNKTVRSYRPESIFPDVQVREVLSAFNLQGRIRPFSRCLKCNGELLSVEKGSVIARVPPRSGRVMEHFWQCRGCGKIYWQGSHYKTLRRWVDDAVN